MTYSKTQRTRFWGNVRLGESNECWLWKRSAKSKGYGQVSLTVNDESRILKAHKVAWEMKHNKTIGPGIRVTHSCEERLCCNPNHLVFTARQSTIPHRVEPVTMKARGQGHGMAKLNDEQVCLIKYRLDALTTQEIAGLFDVGYRTIWNIRQGHTWRHI